MVDLIKVGVSSKHMRDRARTKGDDDSPPQKQAVLEGSLIRQLQEEMEKLKRAVHHLEHQLREAQMRQERPVHEQNIK